MPTTGLDDLERPSDTRTAGPSARGPDEAQQSYALRVKRFHQPACDNSLRPHRSSHARMRLTTDQLSNISWSTASLIIITSMPGVILLSILYRYLKNI